ncbi:MAG TPA: hypothetical protein VLN49_22130 [Gemmatimonadaceae bacterium]|nr:hypothetical protein [Gemmatimonadaceae bacterium]
MRTFGRRAERKERPDALSAWFATHPTEEARITRTNQRIATLDVAMLATLTVDTPAFQGEAWRSRIQHAERH